MCVFDETRPDGGGGNLHYSVMMISPDRGRAWQEVEVPGSQGRVQANVLELSPGRLVAFFRSRWADHIYASHSEDYGRTWSVPESTVLPNNNASIQCIQIPSGALVMAYNQASANAGPGKVTWPQQRYPLTVAISEDEGQTWPFRRHLDTGDDFSGERNVELNRACDYPSLIQGRDGMLHLTYSYHGRQCIKYASFPVEWVRGAREALQ